MTAQTTYRVVPTTDAQTHYGDDEPILARVFLREGEVLWAVNGFAGVCTKTGTPLVSAQFCWDHRITHDSYFGGREFQLGEDRFPCTRHADGTYCEEPDWKSPGEMKPISSCYSQPQCRKCKQYNTLTNKMEAYGDRVTCTNCKDENWYGIGD